MKVATPPRLLARLEPKTSAVRIAVLLGRRIPPALLTLMDARRRIVHTIDFPRPRG